MEYNQLFNENQFTKAKIINIEVLDIIKDRMKTTVTRDRL